MMLDMARLTEGDATARLERQLERPDGGVLVPGPCVVGIGIDPARPHLGVGIVLRDQHGTCSWGPCAPCVADLLGGLLADVRYADEAP